MFIDNLINVINVVLFQAQLVKSAFAAQHEFLVLAASCKQPSQDALPSYFKKTAEKICAIQVCYLPIDIKIPSLSSNDSDSAFFNLIYSSGH